MGDHFSFKWTDFRSSLTQGFHDFLQEEMMVDVTLAAEGKCIQAHKLVLSICSPYFKTLFKVNPCKHPIVILQDIGHSDLSYMLEFMYKGEVGVRHENLKSFLKLADTLKVRGLEGKNFQFDEYTSKIARVKKKSNKEEVSNDSNHSESGNQQLEKKMLRKRKRRLLKLDAVKKLKSETSENDCASMENDCTYVSDDEDDNPLISLIRGEKVNSGECSKHSESETKNKVSFSDLDDEVGPSDDYSESAEDFDAFFPTVQTEDSEQAPQGNLNSLIISRAPRAFVWDYFLKETNQAICLNCGQTFKGQRPNTICEQHLKRRHPEFYKILLEKKIKRAELHMNPVVMGLRIPSYEQD